MKTHPRPDGLRDTYDRIADDWARDHERDTWWREGTAKFASLLPNGARVLDAGCGSGQKAKFFQDRYDRFFSYYTIDEMRAHLDRLGLSLVHTKISRTSSHGEWIQLIARKP